MHERPERPPEESLPEVDKSDPESDPHDVAGVAQDERPPRESPGDARELDAVRRAADDAVEDHHVRRLDSVRVFHEIDDAERDAVGEPLVRGELAGVRLIRPHELDDLARGGADLEQFGLNDPDAAADLEYTGSLDPGLLRGCDDPSLDLVEPLGAVALERPACRPRAEHLLARAAATAAHRATIASLRRGARGRVPPS